VSLPSSKPILTPQVHADPVPAALGQLNCANAPLRVSVLIPVMDETVSLRETIKIVFDENGPWIHEVLILVCKRTSPEALEVCNEMQAAYPACIQIRFQTKPFLGGAMQDGFDWATGTHVLMMASDLETDPYSAKDLIQKATEGYDVVTATRWTTPDAFHGYDPLKRILNWWFQQFFSLLYGVHLTDMTFGYRIFKTPLVKSIAWEEVRHPFLLETIIKPLRLGASVCEIPTTWKARIEGESHNSFWRNFVYFRPGLKVRFARKALLLRNPS
jgi:glycosyltransferase involved in cell wall biosynthesis